MVKVRNRVRVKVQARVVRIVTRLVRQEAVRDVAVARHPR